jgi:hypothetical protein
MAGEHKEVKKMKNLIILALVGIVLISSVPAYAAGSVFTAIPSEYYVNFFAGAAIQGLLIKHAIAPMEGLYIAVGIALAKEVIDSTLLGGQFNWEEAGAMALGSSFVYYF